MVSKNVYKLYVNHSTSYRIPNFPFFALQGPKFASFLLKFVLESLEISVIVKSWISPQKICMIPLLQRPLIQIIKKNWYV